MVALVALVVAQALVAHVALVVAQAMVALVACSGIEVDIQDYALLLVKLLQHDVECRSNFFVP